MKKSTILVVSLVAAGLNMGVTLQAQQSQLTSDQIRIGAQQICPVSGLALGKHGPPIKAKIGEEEIFLCCAGCLKGEVDPAQWATMHKNFARAQGICPVMEKKLPGKPKWAIVNGRLFYVCCPPCIEKIKADPQKYVKKLEALYLASLQSAGTR